MSILQSDKVVRLLENYSKDMPDVSLRYKENIYGIIVLVPMNFNSLPPLTRAVAYARIEELMKELSLLNAHPRIEEGTHLV